MAEVIAMEKWINQELRNIHIKPQHTNIRSGLKMKILFDINVLLYFNLNDRLSPHDQPATNQELLTKSFTLRPASTHLLVSSMEEVVCHTRSYHTQNTSLIYDIILIFKVLRSYHKYGSDIRFYFVQNFKIIQLL